jgi:hypothetical protein
MVLKEIKKQNHDKYFVSSFSSLQIKIVRNEDIHKSKIKKND